MPADNQSRPSVSTTQLMSSALAAVTAAVVGSRLGIAGTLLGAAAGSVIGTLGTAMYAHWLDRTATRVRTVVKLPPAAGRPTDSTSTESTAVLDTGDAQRWETPAARPAGRQPTWRTVGLAAVATFAVALGAITAFEAIAGEPVSTLTGGDAGPGTTLGRAIDSGPPSVEPATPTPTPTETSDPTTTPTTTPSETPTTPPTTPPTETTPPPTTQPATTTPTTPPPTTEPTPPPTD